MLRRERLNALSKKSQKTDDAKIVSAARILPLKRISTGSFRLDRSLGGGLPVGRVTIFRGSSSSGKSSTAYRTIGEAQRLCANCYRPVSDLEVVGDEEDWYATGSCDCYLAGLFEPKQEPDEKDLEYKARLKRLEENSFEEFRVQLVDLEATFDPAWAERLGADPRRILYSRPATAEEAIDLLKTTISTGSVDMVVLDSIAAMAPLVEVNASSAELQQGLQARVMGKFTRMTTSITNDVSKNFGRNVTQIWINQEREKIGVFYGDNTTMPGGMSQLFASSVIVKMWTSKVERETEDSDLIKDFQSEVASRIQINFDTLKNKTAPPRQKSSYHMILRGEKMGRVDEDKYLLSLAEKFGLYRTEGDGAKKVWYVGDESFSKKGDAVDRFYEPAVFDEVKRVLLQRVLSPLK